jgi:hypothetical protein
MQYASSDQQPSGGILIRAASSADRAMARNAFLEQISKLGIDRYVATADERNGRSIRFWLHSKYRHELAPGHNTLHLCEKLDLHPLTSTGDLEKEILLAMLAGPVTFEYPSYAELITSVHIRRNIVEAARYTTLSFHTSKIERPTDYWMYSLESGFTLLPGKPLIEALRMATQPGLSGQQYSFSCYRATEYVILLGIAQELAACNPELLHQLQLRWESKAIMSGRFHEVFLHEYGSMDAPLPPEYYVPGDRLWFRNPDERSSDVTGYEGSWVIYLGNGLFTNFWKCDKPYTMMAKCVEIYHWRSGVYQDAQGNPQIDEAVVEDHVRATMNDPTEVERIVERMMRLRDPKGIYADGGCIDTSREYPRYVCPGTSGIILSD